MSFLTLLLIAAIASIVTLLLGWFWHGPLFGKLFAKAMGMNPESMNMDAKAMRGMYIRMGINVVAMIFMAFVTFVFLLGTQAFIFWHILATLGIVFVGFLLPQTIVQNLWNARPTKDQVTLALIATGYNIVNLVLWGVVWMIVIRIMSS